MVHRGGILRRGQPAARRLRSDRGARGIGFPAALLALTTLLGCAAEETGFRVLSVDEPAPPFALPTLHGDTVRVGPRQPTTLVNLWATWCAPCRHEIPDLEALHQALGPLGLRIVGVSVDRIGMEAVRSFADEFGVTYTIALDPTGSVELEYGVIGLPNTFLVGSDGRVLRSWIGPVNREIEHDIRPVLQASAEGRDGT